MNDDPLDLRDDDGDGINKMCLLFDKEEKNNRGQGQLTGKSGCCIALLKTGSSLSLGGWCVLELFDMFKFQYVGCNLAAIKKYTTF